MSLSLFCGFAFEIKEVEVEKRNLNLRDYGYNESYNYYKVTNHFKSMETEKHLVRLMNLYDKVLNNT